MFGVGLAGGKTAADPELLEPKPASSLSEVRRILRYVGRLVRRPAHVSMDGICLRVPGHATGAVLRSLYAEVYERLERALLPSLLRPDDRVVEIGSAIGCVGIVCARVVGIDRLLMVEANADLIPEIERNFRLNRLGEPRLLCGLAAAEGSGSVDFRIAEQFWSSSTYERGATVRVDQVEQLDTNLLLQQERATVLICDIVSCTRFHGHQDKVFLELEDEDGTTQVQPRVQA
jgi:FkbM family methyltransferase